MLLDFSNEENQELLVSRTECPCLKIQNHLHQFKSLTVIKIRQTLFCWSINISRKFSYEHNYMAFSLGEFFFLTFPQFCNSYILSFICFLIYYILFARLLSCARLFETHGLYSLSGSSVHEILQGRILQQVAISSSGDFPDPGIKPQSPLSPALQAGSVLLSHHGSLTIDNTTVLIGLPRWCQW